MIWPLFLAVAASAPTPEPQALLDKVRAQIAFIVRQAPRYTCTEEIERFWFANRNESRPGCDTDRLRLDVAVGAGQEMFAWHGAKAFSTDEIDTLVTGGPISSGTYFSFLSSIFLEGVATLDYLGVREANGQQLAAFSFKVPIAVSKFKTRTRDGTQPMGYHGAFLIDPATAELQQLDVLTDGMPAASSVCSFNSHARYQTINLGKTSFRLPEQVVMDILDENRQRKKTVSRYQQCREFAAESVLHFDEVNPEADASKRLPFRTPPAGIHVDIEVESPVRLDTAWTGDPVFGRLAGDIVDKDKRILASKGTPVCGRLTEARHSLLPNNYYTIALQFTQLSIDDQNEGVQLTLVRDSYLDAYIQTAVPRRTPLDNSPLSEHPDTYRVRLSDGQVHLKGLVTHWITK